MAREMSMLKLSASAAYILYSNLMWTITLFPFPFSLYAISLFKLDLVYIYTFVSPIPLRLHIPFCHDLIVYYFMYGRKGSLWIIIPCCDYIIAERDVTEMIPGSRGGRATVKYLNSKILVNQQHLSHLRLEPPCLPTCNGSLFVYVKQFKQRSVTHWSKIFRKATLIWSNVFQKVLFFQRNLYVRNYSMPPTCNGCVLLTGKSHKFAFIQILGCRWQGLSRYPYILGYMMLYYGE